MRGKVLINADDFGMTDGVCRGIIQAMRRGVVRSTTAMICVPGGPERIARFARQAPCGLGLHLQLTSGVPCLPPEEIPTLVTARGVFPKKRKQVGDVSPDEVRREWRAQLDRFASLGLQPTHLDSHHHIHRRPGTLPVFCELAAETGLPARAVDDAMAETLSAHGVRRPDACITTWMHDAAGPENLLALLEKAFAAYGEDAVIEVMTHPAQVDDDLRAATSYVEARGRELQALCSDTVVQGLQGRLGAFGAMPPAA